MSFDVLKTGRLERDEPVMPVDIRGHHHECFLPGLILRTLRGIRAGGVIRCTDWMRSPQDSATPSLKYNGYIPICGREWEWTGVTWVKGGIG